MPINARAFEHFLRTTRYFHARTTIISEFHGIDVAVYDDQMIRLCPSWIELINPLDKEIQWNSFRSDDREIDNIMRISADTVRASDADAMYSSTHTLTIVAILPIPEEKWEHMDPHKMVVRCEFSLSGPDPTSVTGPSSDQDSNFTVIDATNPSVHKGYLEFKDISPILYRQYALETDFFHVYITKERQLSFRINTGPSKLPHTAFVGISKIGEEVPGFELKGYVYHPSQPRRQLQPGVPSDMCSYKSTTLFFNLESIPPGMYQASLFVPDTHEMCYGVSVDDPHATLVFHSRQHTEIGSFRRHVDPVMPPRHLSVHMEPISSTDYAVTITITDPKEDHVLQITQKEGGREVGLFAVPEEVPTVVVIHTLDHQIQPGYYEISYIERGSRLVCDTTEVFIGVYKSKLTDIVQSDVLSRTESNRVEQSRTESNRVE